MTVHEMEVDDVVEVLDALARSGAHPCLSGGWSVDANVGQQTRRHDDLDLWLPAAEFEAAERAFVDLGIDRLFPWGNDRPWNFQLHDGGRRRVDLHLYESVADGEQFHYGAHEDGHTIPLVALAGEGMVGGRPARCEDPQWCLRWHLGDDPREVDLLDVRALCERFGWDVPDGYSG